MPPSSLLLLEWVEQVAKGLWNRTTFFKLVVLFLVTLFTVLCMNHTLWDPLIPLSFLLLTLHFATTEEVQSMLQGSIPYMPLEKGTFATTSVCKPVAMIAQQQSMVDLRLPF